MKYLPRIIILVSLVTLSILAGWFARDKIVSERSGNSVFNSATPTLVPTPFVKYSIPSMREAAFSKGNFTTEQILEEENTFTSYQFKFEYYPGLNNELKVTSGMLNIPSPHEELSNQTFPLVVMFRGYVDPSIYTTGIGTRNASRFFAEKGFITIAPDFLGYAESDGNAGNIFESRFQTYTTAISLLESIHTLEFHDMVENKWDGKNIFIWAHSNGGYIALTALESKGYKYPTTLWAPVTKGFPYAILYYTDESPDNGKFIRRELAEFEEVYDTDIFSIDNYLADIQAPILLHQGARDDAIPLEWTNEFVAKMENEEKEIDYYIYPTADHNLRPDWDLAISRDLEFFTSFLPLSQ